MSLGNARRTYAGLVFLIAPIVALGMAIFGPSEQRGGWIQLIVIYGAAWTVGLLVMRSSKKSGRPLKTGIAAIDNKRSA